MAVAKKSTAAKSAPAKKSAAPKKAAPKKTRTVTPKTKAHLAKARPVTVKLSLQHSINGKNYGPGEVKVSYSIARILLEQEQRSEQSEKRVWEKRSHMIIAGRNGGAARKVRVAPENFDDIFAKPPEAFMLTF